MKTIQLLILSFLIINISQAEMISLEIARETQGIKVEYIESTDRGIVRVKNCELCTKDFYTFHNKPVIKRIGELITFETFLTDYWNAKFPTLFLDPKTLAVVRIEY